MKDRTNITRMDYARTKGWWVRLYDGDETLSRMFSDSKYGSKTSALSAAIAFRDEQRRQRPEFATRRSRRFGDPSPGRIWRCWEWRRAAQHEVWKAYIKVKPGANRGVCQTTYSIDKYGSAEAKRLAEQWLEEKRKEQQAAYKKENKQRATANEKRKKNKPAIELQVQRFTKGEKGWWVKLEHDGFRCSRTFHDWRLGGSQPAHDAALEFREQWLKAKKETINGGTITRSWFWNGVRYVPVWLATRDGETRRFSINTHGENQAKTLARKHLGKR